MKKFQVGDVVKVISLEDCDEGYFDVGDIGEVVDDVVEGSEWLLQVEFEHGTWYVDEDQLEIIGGEK